MNRYIPSDVRRELRKEVGYGCPVEGCRNPFLTWHHFDPPWSEGQSNNPAGMIAMCREHHGAADNKTWSIKELRAMKRSSHDPASVSGRFPWAKRSLLIRMGSAYASENEALIRVYGRPLVGMKRNESGLLELSLCVYSQSGAPVFRISNNELYIGSNPPADLELNAGANRVLVRTDSRGAALDLRFKRVTTDELDILLHSDKEAANTPSKEFLSSLPPEAADFFKRKTAHDTPDRVGDKVRSFARQHCVDDEGLIPLIDVQRLNVNYRGVSVECNKRLRVDGSILTYAEFLDCKAGIAVTPNSDHVPRQVGAAQWNSCGYSKRRRSVVAS